MKPRLSYGVISTTFCALLMVWAGVALAQTYSHARIVRLSFVEGTVTLQRPNVSAWSSAPVNTPIEEGFKLFTAEKSFAEVEFENGSTVRVGELSLLEFPEMALSPSGEKITHLKLVQGYATFHLMLRGDNSYEISTSDGTFVPHDNSMFRIDLNEGLLRLEVFKGSVGVKTADGSANVASNSVLEIHPGEGQEFQISKGITKDAWDQWVAERENAQDALLNRSSPGLYTNNVSSLMYGWADLADYGTWNVFPGLGYGWIPTVSTGWSPYTCGRWAWYPNFGYTWISAEPWGWLPFHYGLWNFIPGVGWGWFPGSSLGVWSPAQVIWYQGPGWVGWAPRAAGPHVRNHTSCPGRTGCGAVISVTALQNGQAITPGNLLPVDPARGKVVTQPTIAPTKLSMLPGSPESRISTPRGIAYDPLEGRYINSYTIQPEPPTNTVGTGGPKHVTPAAPSNQLGTPATSVNSGVTRPEVVRNPLTPSGIRFVHAAPTSPPVANTTKASSTGSPRPGFVFSRSHGRGNEIHRAPNRPPPAARPQFEDHPAPNISHSSSPRIENRPIEHPAPRTSRGPVGGEVRGGGFRGLRGGAPAGTHGAGPRR